MPLAAAIRDDLANAPALLGTPHAAAAPRGSCGMFPYISTPSVSETSLAENCFSPVRTKPVASGRPTTVPILSSAHLACAKHEESAEASTRILSARSSTVRWPAAEGRTRPQSTMVSASSGNKLSGSFASSWSSAVAASGPMGPTSTSRPPGSGWRCGESSMTPSPRCLRARIKLVIPRRGLRPKRTARSPPDGSHSAT